MFTRNMEEVSAMFPDLVRAVGLEVKASEMILDGEAVGYDPKTKRLLDFQETIKRKRKHGVGEMAGEIPLRFYVFDLLYKDGAEFWERPLRERREELEKITGNGKKIRLTPQIVTGEAGVLRRYHGQQIKKGLEGIVVKKINGAYDPGRRGFTWVKLKQEEGKKGGGLSDTLDLVVMGYYRGKGKRAGFGIGGFLVGVRNGEGEILTVTKIGTGLSDEQWREMRRRGDNLAVKDKPKEYRVGKNLVPDVWCRPEMVVEVEADNVTRSPAHTAGLALRFPRLVRWRDDKNAAQASEIEELRKLDQLQGEK